MDYFQKLHVAGIRLNSVFPSKNYPNHFQNVTTLFEIDEVLGNPNDLKVFAKGLHQRNMSLVLDLPIYPFLSELQPAELFLNENATTTEFSHVTEDGKLRIARSPGEKNTVMEAIKLWKTHGVDGFYIKGLEYFHNDPLLLENVKAWKQLLGSQRILIVSNALLNKVDKALVSQLVKHIDLVDIIVDVTNGTQQIAEQVNTHLEGALAPGIGPIIQWSLGGVTERRTAFGLTSNATLAATLMALMLPGTPSVFYADEISSRDMFDEAMEPRRVHHHSPMAWNTVPQFTNRESMPWAPHGAIASVHHFECLADMIELRDKSPSIYQNFVRKSDVIEPNASIKFSKNDNVLILERWYPRRHTFVAISNFGEKKLTMDLSTLFYSGEIMIGSAKGQRIFFKDFKIGPIETIILRLDK